MLEKVKRVLAGIGIALVALLAWLTGHFKKKAEREERRADSAELQNDVYKKAEDAMASIREAQDEAAHATGTDVDTAIDAWNDGM